MIQKYCNKGELLAKTVSQKQIVILKKHTRGLNWSLELPLTNLHILLRSLDHFLFDDLGKVLGTDRTDR